VKWVNRSKSSVLLIHKQPFAPALRCSANYSTKAALHVFALGTAQENADVVACLALVEEFAEHLNAGANGCLCISNTDDFDRFTHFTGEIYVLSKDEGGRHTPFFNNYRPQFYFRTTDVTGAIELPEGKEMVMPGDNTGITVKLINPIAMEEGLRFAIREGGRTVGSGVVAKILA